MQCRQSTSGGRCTALQDEQQRPGEPECVDPQQGRAIPGTMSVHVFFLSQQKRERVEGNLDAALSAHRYRRLVDDGCQQVFLVTAQTFLAVDGLAHAMDRLWSRCGRSVRHEQRQSDDDEKRDCAHDNATTVEEDAGWIAAEQYHHSFVQ